MAFIDAPTFGCVVQQEDAELGSVIFNKLNRIIENKKVGLEDDAEKIR